MNMKNSLTVWCFLLAFLFQPAQAMWSRRVLLPAGFVAASLASHCHYHQQNKNKSLRLLTGAAQDGFCLKSFSDLKNNHVVFENCCSSSCHQIKELYKKTFPERSQDKILYEEMVGDLLQEYFSDVWSNPSKILHKQLTQALLFLTKEEVLSSETHYPLYHGTDRLFPLVFRTLMAQRFQENNLQDETLFLQMRNKEVMQKASSIEDPYRYAEQFWHQAFQQSLQMTINQRNPGLGAFKFDTPAVSFNDSAFLAVNAAVMANVGSMTRNSLRFVTPCPIDNSLLRFVSPWFCEENGGKPAVLSQFLEMKKVFEEYGLSDKFHDYQQAVESLCSVPVGVLLQILVPKSATSRAIVCNSSNSPVSPHVTELLEHAQAGDLFFQKALEVDHLCMPIDQELFCNANGGVRMKVVVFGDQEKIAQGLQLLQEMAQELSQL